MSHRAKGAVDQAPAAWPELSEVLLRQVVERAPCAMLVVDGTGNIVLVNAQVERLFAWPRRDLIGRGVEILVPPRLRCPHQGFRDGFLADPQPRPMGAGRELYACRANGSEFPVEIGLNPISTETGRLVLASVIDLSERQRVQRRLEDALQEKTVLLNEVQHRVKNNLQVITSLLKLQADFADDPRVRAILAESCNRVRAMSLTHQLLYERNNFARIDLGDYLEYLVRTVQASYLGDGERVALRLLRPADGVLLDLERAIPCGLLLNELLSNAFKHAFPEERRGEILIELAEDGGEWIRFTVGDDGIGLPPDETLAGCSSLGLQLVALFVEQLHGEMAIGRERGTRFSVSFPKRMENKDEP